jgi:hypothetical protein
MTTIQVLTLVVIVLIAFVISGMILLVIAVFVALMKTPKDLNDIDIEGKPKVHTTEKEPK